MSRSLLTVVTVLALSAMAAATAHLTRPLLRSTARTPRAIAPPAPHVRPTIEEVSRVTAAELGRPMRRTYSRPGPDGGEPRAFLQFDEYDPRVLETDEGPIGVVRLTPFAFVMRGEPDADTGERPQDVVLRADAARVRTERPFDLKGGGPGRILGGALEGQVTITGPDGLTVTGRNFFFNGRALFSDEPVSFELGPTSDPDSDRTFVRGRADKISCELIAPAPGRPGLLGSDMPAVAGIKSIWLRRNVELDVASEEWDPKPGRDAETNYLRLTSAGRFEYRVAERVGSFEDDVRVWHSTSPIGAAVVDAGLPLRTLSGCDRLLLQLDTEDDGPTTADDGVTPAGPGDLTSDLELVGLRALGRRLRLTSREERIAADGGDFSYDLTTQTARLHGGTPAGAARPRSLTIDVDRQRLYCPEAVVRIGDEGLERLDCPGSGWFQTRPREEEGDARTADAEGLAARAAGVQASWTRGVIVTPETVEGESLLNVTARGDVRVVQESEDVRFEGPELTFWVEGEGSEPRVNEVGGRLPLRRVAALQGAIVHAPGVDVRATRLIRVDLAEIDRLSDGAYRRRARVRQVSGEAFAGEAVADVAAPGEEPDPPSQRRRVVASAESIGMTIGLTGDADDRQSELLGLAADGDVDVLQPAEEPGLPPRMRVRGQRADIRGRGRQQSLVVRGGDGGPVQLASGGMTLTAASVAADRGTSSVRVPGGGVMSLPSGGDLGDSLGGQSPGDADASTPPPSASTEPHPDAEAAPVEITWSESLEAAGETLTFFGGVVVRQGETEIRCEELAVHLSRSLDFEALSEGAARHSREDPIEVRSVTFRHNVSLTSRAWEGTELTSLRTAGGLAMLSYDVETGEIRGRGPGTVEQWTRQDADDAPARANAAAAVNVWAYQRLEFTGTLRGNAGRRHVRLEGGVRGLHGAVPRPLAVVSRDEVLDEPGQPDSAAWVSADVVDVLVVDGPKGPTARVQASGHVELEGRQFRASADTLSADGLSGLVTLKARGERTASIWVQDRPGGPVTPTSARGIAFNPRTRTLETDGLKGFTGIGR